jgi:hypothetical protein
MTNWGLWCSNNFIRSMRRWRSTIVGRYGFWVFLLILLIWAVSLQWAFICSPWISHYRFVVGIEGGVVLCAWSSNLPARGAEYIPIPVFQVVEAKSGGGWGFEFPTYDRVDLNGQVVFRNVRVPLWCALAVVVISASTAAVIGRRKARRGATVCAKCSYDLHGNISGICPECGVPIPMKVKAVLNSECEVAKH